MTDVVDWLFQGALTLVFASVLQAIFRRLLGARIGRIRGYVVALVVLAITSPIGLALVRTAGFDTARDLARDPWVAMLVLVLGFLWTLAAGLALLVILESVAPTGSIPSPLAMVRGWRAATRRTRRYLQLSWILIASGLSGSLRRGPGHPAFDQALVRTLERSGVTFVKLGQILSARPDLIPASTATALSRLQANVAPFPITQVRSQLAQEWGRPVKEVVENLQDRPLAAASVAQVHTADLDGSPVVVKVQRPGARQQVAVDSDIVTRFARTAEARFDWARAMGVSELGTGLVKVLAEELDYRTEAANTEAAAKALADHPSIVVPQVLAEVSTSRVLVMSRLSGSTASTAIHALPGQRRTELAEELLAATLDSILVHGVFHADLHPGNIMLLDDGRLGLLDFGAVGVIDSESRALLAVLLTAMAADDAVAATSALRMVLDLPDDVDQRRLRRDLGRMMTMLQHSTSLGSGLFAELFSLLRTYRISVPGDIAGAFRTLMSLESTLQTFDLTVTLVSGARKVMPSIMRRLSSPEQLAAQTLTEGAVAAAIVRRFPERLEAASRQLADGSLLARANPLYDSRDRAWIRALVDDGISALFACVLTIAAILLVTAPDSTSLAGGVTVNVAIASAAGFTAVVLALRVLVRVFTRRDRSARRPDEA